MARINSDVYSDIVGAAADMDADARRFDPANPRVPVTQKCLDADDYAAMIGAVLDGHLTSGKHTEEFERALAKQFSLRCASFVNSGSSANLLALAALMDETLGDARLRPGDEVVTCAAGFPTTTNPIVQLGMVPVFVDADADTLNADMGQVAESCKRPKVRAIMLAHTMGNPMDCDVLTELCVTRKLRFVEDCCDCMASECRGIRCGTFGDLATISFYPAHFMTTGEGGAVMTDSPKLNTIVNSLMSWGKSCWCQTGADATCGKRFGWKLGELPQGYDHKYCFQRIGYNLKNTDVAAALGASQLRKMPQFVATRKRNYAMLLEALDGTQDRLRFPNVLPHASATWFGFPITVRNGGCRSLVHALEEKGISTRPMFSGNLLRHPAYLGVRHERMGDMLVADKIMQSTFYVGCHHGLNEEAMAYLAKTIREAVTR